MKNLSRITYLVSIVVTFVVAFTLGACVGSNFAASSSGASSPASTSAETSASQGSSSSSDSSNWSNPAESSDWSDTSSSTESSDWSNSSTYSYYSEGSESYYGYEVEVDENDDSYAENHLNGDTYQEPSITVERDGTYTDKDHVALYIHKYGTVPSNYVTKTKARKAGWVNTKGNLWDVLPGMSIGGGGFYNDDGMMPDAPGREWFECDIDYEGGYRNAKRIVYSDDGLIYYTDDHYKSFERLY